MRIFAFVTVMGFVAGAAAPGYGQSLADVAKQEQERRQGVKATTKVYSNGDLRPVAGASDEAPAASASATATQATEKKTDAKADAKPDAKSDDKPAAKDAKAASKEDVKDQEYWSTRMRGLNEQLERDRLYAEAIQTRINALTTDFTARDDPAQRSLIAADREKALAELDRLRKQIEDDKDAIGNAEEEARHAGVPPGWLR